YPNLYAFARDAYRPEEPPLRQLMLDTDVRDRLWWGAYKNLISGATTVAHHDPFTRRVFHRFFPIRVLRRYAWSHSLGYDPQPEVAFRNGRGAPFIIHAAEGVDEVAAAEIDRLDQLGLLGPRTVLVHAIALSPRHRRRLAESGTRVVWCPHSNLRLYGRTADVPALLDAGVTVTLGTDATMSGAATLLDEARDALATGLADADAILTMLTTAAARAFALDDGRGTLAAGAPADVLLIPDVAPSPAASLLAARPADVALVLVRGRPRLASPAVAEHLGLGPPNARVEGVPKRLYGDPAGLRRRLLRDAGRRALAEGPLWSMLESLEAPPAGGLEDD
ncbi:MAG: hypothetical protein D6696_01230, partial [Acidobacteria bacterium]